MIFKVSSLRKFIESLIVCLFVTLIINKLVIDIRKYIVWVFIIILIIIFILNIRNKDKYLIKNDVLTIYENNKDINILIKDILFIECLTYLGTSGYFNGDGVREEYSIVTKDMNFKIDIRLKNNNRENLIHVLKNLYNKRIIK
jgi:hypothetical protein